MPPKPKVIRPITELPPITEGSLELIMKKAFVASDIKARLTVIYGNEGVGKSVLAAKLGKCNCFVSDDNGILSLANHPELDRVSFALPFEGYATTTLLLRAAENGQLKHPHTGEVVDHFILDTVSGMCSAELRRSIEDGDVPTEKGKLADNIPTRPHYLLNEQNFGPLMRNAAAMQKCSVTMLSHLRTGTQDVPGASTRGDLHGAAYKMMAKYASVVGYLKPPLNPTSNRRIQVMPDSMVGAKTRLNFGKAELTDEEFVAKMLNWKEGAR